MENNSNNKERKASKAPRQRNNYANLFIPKISVSASVSVSTRSEVLEFSRCHSRTFADFCIIDCSKQNRTEQSRADKGKEFPKLPAGTAEKSPKRAPCGIPC